MKRSLHVVVAITLAGCVGCKKSPTSGSRQQPGPPSTSAGAGPAAADRDAKPAIRDTPWLVGAEEALRPSLMVANFATESDDNLPWGSFFSRLAWEKLNYAPHELFSMPIYGRVWDEFRHINHKEKELRETQAFGDHDADTLARMFGLHYLVRGKVVKSGTRLQIAATVRNIRSDEDLGDILLEGSVDKPQELLTSFCMAVIDAVGVKPTDDERAYLARPDPARGHLFRRALLLWADPPTSLAVVAERWRILYADDPGFTLARVYGVNYLGAVSRNAGLAEVKRLHSLEPLQGRLGILRLGHLRFADRYGDIIREAPAFLRENPNNLSALNMLAYAYSEGDMHEQATAVVDRMIEINPHSWQVRHRAAIVVNAHAWHLRGTDYWADVPESAKRVFPGLMRRCLREEQTAATLNPYNPNVLAMVGGILTTSGGSPEEVEDWCRRAIEIQPDHWSAHYNLVRLYMPGWTAQHLKALAVCRDAAEKNPESASMQWLMAEYLLWYINHDHSQTGKEYAEFMKDRAVTTLIETSMEKSLALAPHHIDRRERAARYYRYKNEYKKAWEHYSKIDTLPPGYMKNGAGEHEYWKDRAWTAAQLKKWNTAIRSANTGMAKYPCQPCRESLLHVLAYTHRQKKEFEASLKYYEQLIAISTAHREWACSGYADVVLRHFPALLDKGYTYAQLALQADPNKPWNRVLIAKYHLRRNETKQARDQLQAALMLDPKNKEALKLQSENPALR